MTAEARNIATVTTPSGREIRVEREFEAPRELVFKAMTDPELIPHWWGPHETKTTVEVMEPRAGGLWRFLTEDCDGNAANFRGVYREVTAPERVVQTWEWEGLPGHVSIETGTLEELDGGRTLFVGRTLFHTTEERDGMLSSGMEKGMAETYERLDTLLAEHS
jgi:uncharacterized protein YndB with AHSA1/START domain